jgi:nickel-type superoxide dismutase maturation protease
VTPPRPFPGPSGRGPIRRLERLVFRLFLGGVLVSLGAVAAFASIVARRHFLRLEVEGLSMVPFLAPGDRVLVLRTDQVAVGDVIAFRDPDGTDAVLVKRLSGIDRSALRVEGDNPGASRDSRHFGPVPRSALVGRVLWRYWSPHPPARIGR